MLEKILGINYARKRLLQKTSSPLMKDFYAEPFPTGSQLLREASVISIDLETTGLNENTDKILSIGMVAVNHAGIELKSRYHKVIKLEEEIPGSSVVIHNITDDSSAQGSSLQKVMPEVLSILKGKVLLAHNAAIEKKFLNAACLSLYNTRFVMPVIDTQVLAKRSLELQGVPIKGNDLRLFNLQKRFGLPVYKSHNALMDALTTAECMLVLISRISPIKSLKLKELLS